MEIFSSYASCEQAAGHVEWPVPLSLSLFLVPFLEMGVSENIKGEEEILV